MTTPPRSTPRSPIRWQSVGIVVGAVALALLFLSLVLRGKAWAWFVVLAAAAVALREIRFLQRERHRDDQRNAPR